MIYLDNGATSFCKPDCVGRAMAQALARCANPGRGGYLAAMEATRQVFACRAPPRTPTKVCRVTVERQMAYGSYFEEKFYQKETAYSKNILRILTIKKEKFLW